MPSRLNIPIGLDDRAIHTAENDAKDGEQYRNAYSIGNALLLKKVREKENWCAKQCA